MNELDKQSERNGRGRLPVGFLLSQGIALLAASAEPLAAGATAPLPTEMEIGLEGEWVTRKLKLDGKAFDEIIANHRAAKVDPAIDFEHESWFFNPAAPAKGWARELRVRASSGDKDRKALVATPEFTDLGADAVARRHYRYVSMGLIPADADRASGKQIGHTLDHVALCKNPFIQGMAPLSLGANFPGHGRAGGEEDMDKLKLFLLSALGLSAEADEDKILLALRPKQNALSSDRILVVSEALSAKLGLSGRFEAEKVEAAILLLSEDVSKMKAEKIAADVDAKIKGPNPIFTPAERDEQIKLATENPALYASLAAKRTPLSVGPKALQVKTGGNADEKTLLARQDAAIREKMAADKCDYAAALIALSKEKPELFSEEVTRG